MLLKNVNILYMLKILMICVNFYYFGMGYDIFFCLWLENNRLLSCLWFDNRIINFIL